MDKSVLTVFDVEQGSDAWFELRAGRITASKFKDMMSKIDTAGYRGLIHSCVGEILSGQMEETYQSDAMKRGSEMEEEARAFYEDIYRVGVDQWGFVTNDNIHPDYIGISPDGKIQGENGIIEIKCPLMKTHVEYLLKDMLPSVYRWQVQGQLLVTGAEYCDFMSYYPGIPPMIKRITPDEQMHEQLLQKMDASVSEIERILNQIKSR